MIAESGHYALVLALALALIQSIVPLVGARLQDAALMNVARSTALAQLLFVGASFTALVMLHVNSDFSVANVYENSHSMKPLLYKITGVWGNHEGSMLLWVAILALFGGLVAACGNKLPLSLRAHVLAVQAWVASAFYLFILVTSNPFLRIATPPIEGRDLNPVLQDIGLAVHPPMLYLGYVGFSISFSFAIAALLEGRIDAAWARWVRPWTLVAWIFLTLGIAMGSYWAYYELGWGGWWFWDPVENASLMPWLAATALLHSASVLAARDALRAWTIMLGVVAFSMSMLGTFLVRSGILTSVHAFAVDPQRGAFILVLLALYIGGALARFALRAGAVSEGQRVAATSREGALVFNNVMLSAILAIVLLGTLYPLLTEAFDVRVSVGPPYFNPVGAIFAVPMLLVMAVGPLLRWRRDSLARIQRPVVLIGVILLAATAAALAIGGVDLLPLLGLALSAALALASLMPLRRRRLHRVPLSVWGMVVAHFGLAVAVFGMASETAFSDERLAAVAPGETVRAGPWSVTLAEVLPNAGPNWTAIEGHLLASYRDGDPVALDPQSRSFWAPVQETTESALATRWNGQLYAVVGTAGDVGAVTEGDVRRWQLRLWWKPFVTFIWYGGILVALGGALALVGRVAADVKRRTVRARAAERRAEVIE